MSAARFGAGGGGARLPLAAHLNNTLRLRSEFLGLDFFLAVCSVWPVG